MATQLKALIKQENVQLAARIDFRLLNLFKRWQPDRLRQLATQRTQQSQTVTSTPLSNGDSTTSITTAAPLNASLTDLPALPTQKTNPFKPWKNPRTGNWHGPHYSLRRQADLFKLAKEYGVLALMPLCHKHPEVKEQKRLAKGLRVQGTGVDKKVKGKKWERSLGAKLDARRKAMSGMPELIKQWKQTGRGRGWKKWPK